MGVCLWDIDCFLGVFWFERKIEYYREESDRSGTSAKGFPGNLLGGCLATATVMWRYDRANGKRRRRRALHSGRLKCINRARAVNGLLCVCGFVLFCSYPLLSRRKYDGTFGIQATTIASSLHVRYNMLPLVYLDRLRVPRRVLLDR